MALHPGDLVTAYGTKPIRAFVEDGSLTAAVAAELELRDYPGLQLVAVDVTTSTGVADAGNTAPFVELTPKTPLASAWYVLSLKRVPDGLSPANGTRSRFHPASHPVAVRARFCNKGKSPVDIVALDFSEPVTNAPEIVKIEEIATGKKCAGVSPGPVGFVDYAYLGCVGFTGTAVRVVIGPGLASESGAPVTTVADETLVDRTFDLPTLPLVENDLCRLGRFD